MAAKLALLQNQDGCSASLPAALTSSFSQLLSYKAQQRPEAANDLVLAVSPVADVELGLPRPLPRALEEGLASDLLHRWRTHWFGLR